MTCEVSESRARGTLARWRRYRASSYLEPARVSRIPLMITLLICQSRWFDAAPDHQPSNHHSDQGSGQLTKTSGAQVSSAKFRLTRTYVTRISNLDEDAAEVRGHPRTYCSTSSTVSATGLARDRPSRRSGLSLK